MQRTLSSAHVALGSPCKQWHPESTTWVWMTWDYLTGFDDLGLPYRFWCPRIYLAGFDDLPWFQEHPGGSPPLHQHLVNMSIQLHLTPILPHTPACCTRSLNFLQPFQIAGPAGTKTLHLAEVAQPAFDFLHQPVTCSLIVGAQWLFHQKASPIQKTSEADTFKSVHQQAVYIVRLLQDSLSVCLYLLGPNEPMYWIWATTHITDTLSGTVNSCHTSLKVPFSKPSLTRSLRISLSLSQVTIWTV